MSHKTRHWTEFAEFGPVLLIINANTMSNSTERHRIMQKMAKNNMELAIF